MAEAILTVVMSYDIVGPTTRRKVAKLLEERMVRVQKSVFEARMSGKAANRLFEEAEIMLEDSDSLRMYVMSRSGLGKSRASGGAPLPEEGSFWLL